MNEDQFQLMVYRLQRADEAFQEACENAQNKRWKLVGNRLYYACFYAATAIFIKREEKSPFTHAGVKVRFNEVFVKTGIVSKDFGKFYNDIFSIRQDADYKDFAVFDEDDVLPFIAEAENFIQTIKKLIEA